MSGSYASRSFETVQVGGLINPDAFPVPDFNTDVLDYQASRLRSYGSEFAQVGRDIKGSWAGLSAFYTAPEADVLFSVVDPVATDGEEVETGADQAATALETFAQEVRDIKVEWIYLKSDANSFLSSIEGDDDWQKGGFFDSVSEKVAEHNALLERASRLVQDYQAAEMACANAINAGLAGRTNFRFGDLDTNPEDVGPNEFLYGYGGNAGGLDTPWGGPAETDHSWFMDADAAVGDFMDGLGENLGGLIGSYSSEGWNQMGRLDAMQEYHWGNITALGALAGLYNPETENWEEVDFQTWGNTWKEAAHSVVPWREWDERPGYTVGTVVINVAAFVVAPSTALRTVRNKGGSDGFDLELRMEIPFLQGTGSTLANIHIDLPKLEDSLSPSDLADVQDALDRLENRIDQDASASDTPNDPTTQDLDDGMTIEDVLDPSSAEANRLREEYEGDFLENDVRGDGAPDSWEASETGSETGSGSNSGDHDGSDENRVPALVGPRSDSGESEGIPDPSPDRPVDLTGNGDDFLDIADGGDGRIPVVNNSIGGDHATDAPNDDDGPGADYFEQALNPDGGWTGDGGWSSPYDQALGGFDDGTTSTNGNDRPSGEDHPDPGTPPGDRTAQERMEIAQSRISDGAVTFRGDGEAVEYGNSHWNDYVNGLSDDHQRALARYSASPPYTPNYEIYNGFLRNPYDNPPAWLLEDIRLIDEALRGNPLPDDVVVSRGTGLRHLGVDPWELNNVADGFTNDGYFSTSLGSVPDMYRSKDAVLHLRVPQGTPALWMPEVSRSGVVERELLLGRGTRYRVVDAILDENGQWQIYAEVIR